ncbi:MAG TPA: DNA (cytosine-5-)-methyltransferase, partial [Herpetosiphonaceae bacterium]|nr:DNA (cytosine-5-)-methyltransferase [Herpetosiphonaceae bacterium]
MTPVLTEIGLFAGIGGFSLGFRQAGIKTVALVEIDKACQGLLARRFPDVPVLDDVRTAGRHNLPWANIVSFGFPCQDLSVAGKRAGLAGARSSLFFEAIRIVHELRPDYAVWENVPGLLTANNGRDFAAVLMALDKIGYSGAWTVLDAQFFGVAQRRQRVFGVFARRDIGAARCAEILALAARLPWNTAAGDQARQAVASTLGGSTQSGGFRTTDLDNSGAFIYQCQGTNVGEIGALRQGNGGVTGGVPFLARSDTTREGLRQDESKETIIAHTLRAEGHDASEDGTGRGVPLVVSNGQGDPNWDNDRSFALDTQAPPAIVFDTTQITSGTNRSNPQVGDPSHPLAAGAHAPVIA